jgi:branched-chain amino acid transport system ATP-binding protein
MNQNGTAGGGEETVAPNPVGDEILALAGVTAGYGRTTVLRDVSLSVPGGTVVALLGPNGAGKTTLLRVASGLLGTSAGQVRLGGEEMTRRRAFQRAQHGLCLIPEGRGIFPNLSVKDNLVLQIPPWRKSRDYQAAVQAFPVLGERLSQTAGSMSGGQQQMLALSRCFLADPKVVLLDEVSMGLAPRIIDEIFEALLKLKANGVSLLLVEQYVSRALQVADKVYLLGRGQITFSGTPSQLNEDELMQQYVGGQRAADENGAPPPTNFDRRTA